MTEPTYRLKIDGKPVSIKGRTSFTAREIEALVETARKFNSNPAVDSGSRIDTERVD